MTVAMKDSFATYSSTEVVRAVSLEVASWTWEMKLPYSRAAQRGSAADSSASSRDGEIRVEVADHGRGFDRDRLPPDRFGVRGSILDTMRALPNGGADVRSGGDGTRVTLWWRP